MRPDIGNPDVSAWLTVVIGAGLTVLGIAMLTNFRGLLDRYAAISTSATRSRMSRSRFVRTYRYHYLFALAIGIVMLVIGTFRIIG